VGVATVIVVFSIVTYFVYTKKRIRAKMRGFIPMSQIET
jgi:hypothetical protein